MATFLITIEFTSGTMRVEVPAANHVKAFDHCRATWPGALTYRITGVQ